MVRRSLSEAAAKTMVHAFITCRIDYCNSVLHGVSAVHHCKMYSVHRRVLYCASKDLLTSLLTFTTCTGCQFNGGWSTRCACLYTSVYISQHPSSCSNRHMDWL